ncbi:hypothetical protein [Egicoccus sp. AB-alg2]|uniref:hypothetical protein n=1 Tax=Egicoccus sp. AB-alg2 TaxID=3242693 RepID=UPI00359D860D
MTYHEAPEPRRHPYGRLANALVWAGATLGMIQAAVFVLAWASAPARGSLPLSGAPLFGVLFLTVGAGWLTGWLCWRALQAWRALSPQVLGRLLIASLVLLPLGPLLLGLGGAAFSLAGLLLGIAALMARPRVVAATERRR